MAGFFDDVAAAEAIRFDAPSSKAGKPFVLWLCMQVPHMDGKHMRLAKQEYLAKHDADKMPLPRTWNDDLEEKP
ncbi:hypothetical protein Poly51_54570 [Rubripirellula tenax]|uniref:Uncharacterized protein n=1 Tax=Rubripirellula tenax TaxID=2528015 RepID=A0A5C6EGT3_9BACT|nr:hypothetical protein [Rubripirellula tenax]TWU47655.1 hypothetical protein Poly51_54570 [Rubripirellula tenax]